ncbi:unnamed protein product, partial [marine sediment metagenome]
MDLLTTTDNNIKDFYFGKLKGMSIHTQISYLASLKFLFKIINKNNVRDITKADFYKILQSNWFNSLAGNTQKLHIIHFQIYFKFSDKNELSKLCKPENYNGVVKELNKNELINRTELEQILLKDLKIIAKEYLELEKLKKTFSKIILKNLDELDFSDFIKSPRFYIKEKFLKKSLLSSNLRGLNIVSVDGSSVTKKFMNADFSFLKGIAVKYYFKENHVANIEYFPDLSGFNNYFVQGDFFNRDESTVDAKVSMDMRYLEINLLNEMIKKSNDIDLIIIDGSIVIMPINLLFSKDPEISIKYDILLKEYHKLYSNCKEKGIILIGSIKDTRT